MQMQSQNTRSCPRCTQCVKEAWYSREEYKKQTGDEYNQKTFLGRRLENDDRPLGACTNFRLWWHLYAVISFIQGKETGPVNNPLRFLLLGAAPAGSTTHRDPSSSLPSRRTFDAFSRECATSLSQKIPSQEAFSQRTSSKSSNLS